MQDYNPTIPLDAPMSERPSAVDPDTFEASPSTVSAACEACGVEGWRADWPYEGGIVPDERGRPLCDRCAWIIESFDRPSGVVRDNRLGEAYWDADERRIYWIGSNGECRRTAVLATDPSDGPSVTLDELASRIASDPAYYLADHGDWDADGNWRSTD